MWTGEQRVRIRADRIEGDVAEIQQAGEADDDVEAEREQHIENRVVRDAHPTRANLRERERQHGEREGDEYAPQPQRRRARAPIPHARSPTRSPSKPDGRKTSTRISTRKANTSW